MVEPTPLFLSLKERFIALFVLLVIGAIALGLEYRTYQKVFGTKRYYTDALVLNQYKKGKKWVLKLQAKEGFIFYTTSYEDLKDLRARKLKVALAPKRVGFIDYLHPFYVYASLLALEPADLRYRLYRAIVAQHSDPKIGELFGALFLATPLSYEIRHQIASFGVSHLVAISGFHLGVIGAVISFFIFYLLKPIFARFFPYANLLFFSLVASLVGALSYLLFLGPVPSLVRSFVMMLVGFFLLHYHIRLLSFETLLWVVLALLALFPRFLFSVAFWLSVAGVFVIYLFLHHFPNLKKWQMALAVNIFVFWMMLPFSLLFGSLCLTIFFAPLLSLLFMFWYPLEALLHLLGVGGVLDFSLSFLAWGCEAQKVEIPLLLVGVYTLLLLLAMRYRLALYGAALTAGVVVVYYLA